MIDSIRSILRDTLQIGSQADAFTESTQLLGAIPELDSMAVVTVLTMIEEEFDIEIEDDDISAEVFETVGSLMEFVAKKTDL